MMTKESIMMLLLLLPAGAWAQTSDDMYFVPKKNKAQKSAQQETYYIGSDRDVDEYNRHGSSVPTYIIGEDDVVALETVVGEYPDSSEEDEGEEVYSDYDDGDDYCCTRALCRWYGGYYPLYAGWGLWDDPWYWSWYYPWHYAWYSPWYWGGWYYPTYWLGWHGGRGHGHLLAGGRGQGFSNRGTGVVATRGSNGVRSYRTGGNRYNSIARRNGSGTSTRPSTQRTTARTTTTPSSARTTTSSFGTTRSTYGGSRSGSFGGGARGGGFGGGHSGGGFGGGHSGGRR